MEILFIVLFAYLRKVRDTKLRLLANAAASQANLAAGRAKEVLPVVAK